MPLHVRLLLSLLLGLLALPAAAQTYTYTVYVDGDRNPATGCSVTLPGSANTVTGAETRLVATVDQPTLQVTQVVRQSCSGGSFGSGTNVGGGYPVGLNNGVGGTDVIELSDSLVALGGGLSAGQVRIYFAAANAGASDALFTPNGQPGPNGIFVGTPFLIPFLGLGGLLLLVGGFVLIAWRFHGRYPNAVRASAVVLLIGAGVAIAANFVSDGQVGDWAGVQPAATDAAGDSTDGNQALDIRAGFGAFENDRLHFRIDVTDAENNPPVATPLAVTVLEDSGATTLTLAGTDLDNDPLTFAIVTPPTRGVLGPVTPVNATSATVTYTPNANANGTDTFTFRANDGQINSAPATATITITPVNDVPSFTAGPNQTVIEDAGAQTVNPWATAINDGDPEVAQALSFVITNNDNAALFSVAPAISPTGVLTYTPAPNANGSATITLRLDDDGGTANGGVNQSPTQSFTITVTAVNDAPTFTAGANQSIDEDAAAQTVVGWATAISDGDPELTQTLAFQFNVTGTTGNLAFTTPLAIDPTTGTLTYAIAPNTNGVATVEVRLQDNGSNVAPNVNISAPQTFTITVNAVNDAPINTVPGIQATADTSPLVLSTANANAISVDDLDAAAGVVQMTFATGAAGNGTLTLANPGGVLATLTGNGTATVTATGTITALNTALNGAAGSLTYTPVVGTTAARTITVTTNDQGNTGSGGPQTDVDTITVNVDAPPVVSSTPANGATIAENAAITVSFNEAVNVAAGITFTCTAGTVSGVGGTTGSNVTALNLTYTGVLGGTCTLTVPAVTVTDVDTIDPPDSPTTPYVATFSVDAAPSVTSTSPITGATVANDVNLVANFSEPVTFSAASFTLECPSGTPFSGGIAVSGSGTTTATINPTGNLPAGACALTVVAANVFDSDTIDPPDTLPANQVVNFTVDAAPAFLSSNPAANGAVVGTGQAVSFTYSENVANLGGAITLDCGGAVAGTISGGGTPTLTFTPSAALTAGASCTATAVAAQIGDSDAFDPPQNPVADVVRTFAVDSAPTITGVTPANAAVNVGLASNIVVTFSEPVNFGAGAFTLECPGGSAIPFTVSGSGTNTATIDPTPATLPINTLCVFTANAALVTDVDAADPPDAGAGTTSVSFTTVNDQPPSVSLMEVEVGNVFTAVPLGAGIGSDANTQIRLTFSETVNPTGVWGQLLCSISGSRTIGSGLGVTVLDPVFVLSPSVNLSPGDACTLTVFANQVVDDDAIDPPDNMTANFVATFNVDAAPTVTAISPANGATGVTTTATISATFSEPVNIASAADFNLECPVGSPIGYTVTSPPTLPASTSSVTLTPAGGLPEGTACTFTVLGTIGDSDIADPPNAIGANVTSTFTTDAAPTVTTVTPAESATVGTGQAITVNFSENVDLGAAAFTLNCSGAIGLNASPPLPAIAASTITLTPATALPAGTACTLTVVATEVTDSDSNDPPNAMLANFVRNFSTDAAPTVTTTTPANGATNVNPTGSITVNFSESVNFSTTPNAANTSFDLECPAGTPVDFTVTTASPAASVVLNPLDSAIAGRTCALIVRAAGITDADALDPPNDLAADFPVTIGFGAIANDDTRAVTPHLTHNTALGATELDDNDILGTGVITSFGFGTCTGTAAGAQLDAGATNGRLTINADGTYSYEPPAGVANATRTFCYTVTGGDTANVAFNIANTELVWFVNAASPAGGIGTQARPFQDIAAANAVDTANDTVYLAFNAGPPYATSGWTLLPGERVIGQASGSTLAAITGITPATGSAFPPLGGGAPTIDCLNATCITLGTGNTLRGFIVGDSGTGGTDISGTSFGTLTVGELTLGGNGRALNLTTGTLNGSFVDIDSSATSNQAININAVGGTWSVTNAVAVTSSSNASNTVDISNLPAGASITFGGGMTVAQTLVGNGIRLSTNNAAASINLGAIAVTTNNGTGLLVNASPVTITGSTSTVVAQGGPALDIDASNVGTATLATASSTFSATNGMRLNNISGTLTINGGAIATATNPSFLGTGTLGTTTYAGSLTKSNAGKLVSITGAAAGSVTLSGALSCTGACSGIDVLDRGAGTIAFTNASKVLNTGTNPAVTLSNNDAATVNFSGGGLDIDTTSGTGFSATGGGVVNVSGTGNSISSTTGAALVVDHPAVQATGLEFATIAATGATSTHGIRLNNISGAVTVTGATTIGAKTTAGIEISNSSATIALSNASTVTLTGRPSTGIRIAGSSGTIGFGNTTINSTGVGTPAIRIDASSSAITFAQTNIDMGGAGSNENFLIGAGPSADAYTPRDNAGDGDAIYVTGLTGSLAINGGTITRPGDDGIDIRNSRNLSLSGMSFVEAGRSPGATCLDCNSSGVQAYALTGTNSVANSSFLRGRLRNFYISNPSGTTTLNITGSTFDDTRGQGTPATDNLQIYTSGTASAAFNIANSTFLRSATNQINAVAKDTSTITELDITGITMRNDGGPSSGVRIDGEGAASVAFNLNGNPVLYTQDENVVTVSTTAAAQMQGRIQNNPDMRFTTASAGGSTFGLVRALSDGTTSRVTLDVSGNAMLLDNGTTGIGPAVAGFDAARIDIRIANNTLDATGAPNIPLDAINGFVNNQFNAGTAKILCATLSGNTVTGNWARAARMRALGPTATYITNYATSFAATWASQGNSSGALLVAESVSGGGVISAPPVPCATPSHALP